MKSSFELPDQLLRKAKSAAAQRGLSLSEFVAEALRDKLASDDGLARADEPAWMRGFGGLKHLHKETMRVQSIIDRDFGPSSLGGDDY